MKERLKLIAKYYGRSLRGLSRNSGLHPATLSAIVYNDKISVKSLVKIHKSYPINMHWLITGEGQITPQLNSFEHEEETGVFTMEEALERIKNIVQNQKK